MDTDKLTIGRTVISEAATFTRAVSFAKLVKNPPKTGPEPFALIDYGSLCFSFRAPPTIISKLGRVIRRQVVRFRYGEYWWNGFIAGWFCDPSSESNILPIELTIIANGEIKRRNKRRPKVVD